jgi:hypothetical protein
LPSQFNRQAHPRTSNNKGEVMEKTPPTAILYMFETLQCYEGDAELVWDKEQEQFFAEIAYYAHGRTNVHKIPLTDMASSARSGFIVDGAPNE